MLPGGLWENGILARRYGFRPVDGRLEMRVADAAAGGASLPAAVSHVLETALDHIGAEPATLERVRSLCVADRQFLMRELQSHLGESGFWSSHRCSACETLFDFQVDYAALPVVEARAGFPYVDVDTDLGSDPIRLRLPNGADQERLAQMDSPEHEGDTLRTLLEWCKQPGGNSLETCGDEALERIDSAMDEISPAVVTKISATCSHCGAAQVLPLDPYSVLGGSPNGLLEEIHQLASHYHWGEKEILALPRSRRLRYLALIDRARGMVQ